MTFKSVKPRYREKEPAALLTPFGLILVGPLGSVLNKCRPKNCFGVVKKCSTSDNVLHSRMEKIWITEAMGVRTEVKTPIPGEDCRALNDLNETFLYLGDR